MSETPRQTALLAASEVALFGVSAAAAVSLTRIFEGTDFLPEVFLAIGIAHGIGAISRRLGWNALYALLATVVAEVLAITWILYPDSVALIVPTFETFDLIRADVDAASSLFTEVSAPTQAVSGFVVMSMGGLALVSMIADWAAFRLWLSFEATAPALAVFVFTAVLGTETQRVLWGAVLATTALLFILMHRVARRYGTGQWLTSPTGRDGATATLRLGAALCGVAVLIAAALSPLAPGAQAEPIVALRNSSNPLPERVTVSPLVDIQGRLVNQADVELFTVESTERSYWRLTSLDEFDGRIWSSSGSYKKADGTLDTPVADQAHDAVEATQTFDITRLAQIWAPAAFEPKRVKSDAATLRFDERSSTLITEENFSDGLTYTVESVLPRHTPESLVASVGQPLPDEIASGFLDLPAGFSPRAVDLASQLSAGVTTSYDKAIALQNFFRSEFTYSLGAPPGHGLNAIDFFLFESRIGYCEQFAGTFAAMARSIGLPSRVAVGFTPGELGEDGRYHVRGEHAHAWPEVYLQGAGWVPFEPTPGRGAPGAEPYTDVPEQQAAPGDPNTATTLAPATSVAPTQPDPTATTDAGASPSTGPDQVTAGGANGTGGTDEGTPSVPWPLIVGLLVMVAIAAGALGLPVLERRRRDERWRTTVESEAKARLAWSETSGAYDRLGLRQRVSETRHEFAVRSAALSGIGKGRSAHVSEAVDSADWSIVGVSNGVADRAATSARQIVSESDEAVGTLKALRQTIQKRLSTTDSGRASDARIKIGRR